MGEIKNLYFQSTNIRFFPTGTELLDCILGGGWAIGRLINVVGDKATGKSLLAYEACTSFAKAFPSSPIWYNDIEQTTDESYLKSLGINPESIDLINKINNEGEPTFRTVEAVGDDLLERVEKLPPDEQALYVLDSYDALSDVDELERKMNDKSYGAAKAKGLNAILRKANQLFPTKGLTCVIISQIRENIGTMSYGPAYRRQGEKPLNFYSSQVLWLKPKGKIEREISKLKKIQGVIVKAECQKNKCGNPFGEGELMIYFNYGVDNVGSNLNFLAAISATNDIPEVGELGKRGLTDFMKKFHFSMTDEERKIVAAKIATATKERWQEIDSKIQIPHLKGF